MQFPKGRRDWTDKASLRSWLHPGRQTETHLKIHGDWGPSPLFLVISGQQLNLCTDLGFLHSSHTFYPVRESPEVRRCLSLLSLSLHVPRADRSTEQILPPQALPLQHSKPDTLTYFQTMAFSLALYFAFPFIQMTCTPLVLRGVGIRTWTAESGEQGQGGCSPGTPCSLREEQLLPREHSCHLGPPGLSHHRAQRTSATTRHPRLALWLLTLQQRLKTHFSESTATSGEQGRAPQFRLQMLSRKPGQRQPGWPGRSVWLHQALGSMHLQQ